MKQKFYLTILILLSLTLNAQKKHKQDIEAIKKMCGCFEISFNFAETFNYVEDSLYMPSKTYITSGLELAKLIVDENDKISIQHILQVGPPSSPYVIKHWRQDWIYENSDFYFYDHDNKWNYVNKDRSEVKGQWSQKVYQVDDSPRYEGTASWVHVDGRSFWSNSTDAPLPRREITKRQDYNVTLRRNHHEIFDWGWQHGQDNDKIIRKSGEKDFVLAQEKGINNYRRVDNERCIAAQDFWKKNKDKWYLVRNKWNIIFNKKDDIRLRNKVDGKRLFQYLFPLEVNSSKKEISEIIDSYIF